MDSDEQRWIEDAKKRGVEVDWAAYYRHRDRMRQFEEPTLKEIIRELRPPAGTSWLSWIGFRTLWLLCAILATTGAFTFIFFLDTYGKGEPWYIVLPFAVSSLATIAAAICWGLQVHRAVDKRSR